jgi:hypothetical protein
MDSKYTTITVTRDLSKKLRKLAIDKDMRTSELLEFMLNELVKKDFEVLKSEVDKDFEELGIKKKK